MKTDYIKPSVYKKIYPIMQYENALALRLSLETGLRIGDVLSLKPEQLEGRTIRYTAQKTGKSGKKVISADLSKRLMQISGKKYIFYGRNGNKPRTRQAVWKDIKKASRVLHLEENVSCHSARKTYAVDKFHKNGLPTVQKELQHDRADTTMIYAFADLITEREQNRADSKSGAVSLEDLNFIAEVVAQKVLRYLERSFRLTKHSCGDIIETDSKNVEEEAGEPQCAQV